LSIQVGVAGSQGRMGQSVLQVIALDPTLHCLMPIDRSEHLSERLKSSKPDVLIDFTEPLAALEHLELCAQYSIPVVLGVTGFSEAQKRLIQKASLSIPIVFSPNFSLGINVLFQLLGSAAHILNGFKEKGIEVDVAIQETHHKHKKDLPSGTSLSMGEILSVKDYACSRIGDIAGDHTAVFALEGERLEITHRAQNRMIFARGAVVAAKWLKASVRMPGLYTMQDVLNLQPTLKKGVDG
jgi:4-hydroxy-tetrahydrodipicolinate reductase